MNYLTSRAICCAIATSRIEDVPADSVWDEIADLFGLSAEEKNYGAEILADEMLASLQTAADVRLVEKYLCGIGSGRKVAPMIGKDVLAVAYEALLRVAEVMDETRTAPAAGAAAHTRDHAASVLYAVQILLRNPKRRELALEVLSDAFTAGGNCDAGILLLRTGSADEIYGKLAEMPEMILHPEALEELAIKYGIDPDTAKGTGRRFGF